MKSRKRPTSGADASHAQRACRLCHVGLLFDEPTRPCADCHTTEHVGPSDCLSCHMPTVWSDVRFTHPSVFPHSLEEFTCAQCHVTGDFTVPRSTICLTCHW